jgi:hypothetical protein
MNSELRDGSHKKVDGIVAIHYLAPSESLRRRSWMSRRGELKKIFDRNHSGYSLFQRIPQSKRRDLDSLQLATAGTRTAEHTYNVFIKSLSNDGTLSRAGMEALISERKRQVKYTGDVPLKRVSILASSRRLTASWGNS